MICLICNTKIDRPNAFGQHLKWKHKISTNEYINKYNLNNKCINCNNDSKTRYCSICHESIKKFNPMYGKSVYSCWINKYGKDIADKKQKELNNKFAKATTKLWTNSNYRENVINKSSKPRKESFKKEQSLRITQWYKDNPIQRTLRSIAMKNSWKNEKILPNISSINESEQERTLFEEIKQITHINIRKCTIKLKGKWFYPDILIENNKIIEYYGSYWHADPTIFKENDIVHHKLIAKDIWKRDNERIELLKQGGYDVLVIWQTEYMNNKELVMNKIKKYIGETV